MKILLTIVVLLAVAGCQSPATVYTNGLILWCGSSAIGLGWGEYTEVPEGGRLERVITNNNSNACVYTISSLTIENNCVSNRVGATVK